jgi:PPOX class probable F420-dependent enzyme
MDEAEMRRRVATAASARMATVDDRWGTHLVATVFAVDGDNVYLPVDSKPKRDRRLRRLDNVRRDPRVTLLVDDYTDDWDTLWWVRINGEARVVEDGGELARARELLAAKYSQYRDSAVQRIGPVIVLAVTSWHGWEAAPAGS